MQIKRIKQCVISDKSVMMALPNHVISGITRPPILNRLFSCIKKNSLMKEEENKLRDNYKASNNFARASDTKRSNKDSSQKLIESHHQDKNSRIDVIHKETRLFKRIGTKPSIASYSSCIGSQTFKSRVHNRAEQLKIEEKENESMDMGGKRRLKRIGKKAWVTAFKQTVEQQKGQSFKMIEDLKDTKWLSPSLEDEFSEFHETTAIEGKPSSRVRLETIHESQPKPTQPPQKQQNPLSPQIVPNHQKIESMTIIASCLSSDKGVPGEDEQKEDYNINVKYVESSSEQKIEEEQESIILEKPMIVESIAPKIKIEREQQNQNPLRSLVLDKMAMEKTNKSYFTDTPSPIFQKKENDNPRKDASNKPLPPSLKFEPRISDSELGFAFNSNHPKVLKRSIHTIKRKDLLQKRLGNSVHDGPLNGSEEQPDIESRPTDIEARRAEIEVRPAEGLKTQSLHKNSPKVEVRYAKKNSSFLQKSESVFASKKRNRNFEMNKYISQAKKQISEPLKRNVAIISPLIKN